MIKSQSPAELKLTDTYGTITIRPTSASANDPILCREWDLGAPQVRVTSTPRNGGDGDIEGAGYTGSRTVTMELQIFGDDTHSPYWYAERLAAMTHPARKPVLSLRRGAPDSGGDTWTMNLRGNPFSISYGKRAAAMLEMQLSFECPDGYLLSPLRQYQSLAASAVTITGWALPLILPLNLGTGAGSNPGIVINLDSAAPVAPVIAIYGPITNPKISLDTGEVFAFKGLTLGSGQFVHIDMNEATVRLNGDVDSSVYHLVDWTVSTFWRLQPGVNTITYIASSGRVLVQFYERRMTI